MARGGLFDTRAAASKIDRKSLKEDPFRDTAFWLIDWVYQRRVWFITLIATVLVVLIAGFGYYFHRRAVQSEQGAEIYRAERAASDPQLSEQERQNKAREAYEAFIAKFPDGSLAPVAWMHLAGIAWRQKDVEGARTAFQAVLTHANSSPAQRDLARLGVANLEEAGGNLEASEALYRAVSDQPYAALKAYSLGRIAMQRNQSEEARRQLEKVARGDPGSELAQWARQTLDYLP